jgi:hypothetical protein
LLSTRMEWNSSKKSNKIHMEENSLQPSNSKYNQVIPLITSSKCYKMKKTNSKKNRMKKTKLFSNYKTSVSKI